MSHVTGGSGAVHHSRPVLGSNLGSDATVDRDVPALGSALLATAQRCCANRRCSEQLGSRLSQRDPPKVLGLCLSLAPSRPPSPETPSDLPGPTAGAQAGPTASWPLFPECPHRCEVNKRGAGGSARKTGR